MVSLLDEKSEKSIMEIISEMVREGESEEKIRGTLKSLGVKEEEINRLLLVAQAHTFELLKSEIDRIVESHVSDKKPELKEFLKTQVTKVAEETLPAIAPEQKGEKQPEKTEKKSNFFSDLATKIFGKREKPEGQAAETFITPENAQWKEQGGETPLSQETGTEEKEAKPEKETFTFSKADLRKLSNLESWQTRYKKKLSYLKDVQRKSKLSERQIAKKVELETKIRAYGLKAGELRRKIPKEMLKKIRKKKIAYKDIPDYIAPSPVDAELQLKTMKDLSEAAKAITMAAERIVRTAPKPKIVISGEEEFLTIDQEIEKTKRLKKMLEIDFYKRRVNLHDFQSKMMEYQSKQYELEEKKRILEKSKEMRGKAPAGEKVPAEIQKALEQKLEGRINGEKLLEIENYASELLKRYNIPRGEIEKEIKVSDNSALLANLEKMATVSQLETQAKQAIEESQKRERRKGSSEPAVTIIGEGIPYRQGQEAAAGGQGTTIIYGGQQPQAAPTGEQQQAQQGNAVQQSAAQSVAQEKPQKQPKQRLIIIPPFFQPKQQGTVQQQQPVPQQGQTSQGGQAETNIETATIVPVPVQPQVERRIIERAPIIIRENTPTEFIRQEKEPEKVVLKTMGEKQYVRAPPSEPRRIMVEPQKSWSEAEIPSFPQTLEKGEREKIKTIVKEINKYRIITDLDRVLQAIKENGIIGIEELNKQTGIEKQRLQELVEILEDHKLAKLEYSTFGEEKILDANYVKPKVQPAQKQAGQQQAQEKKVFSLPKLPGFGKKKN